MIKLLFFAVIGIVISKHIQTKNTYDCCYDYLESHGDAVFGACSGNNYERCKTCKYNVNEREEK